MNPHAMFVTVIVIIAMIANLIARVIMRYVKILYVNMLTVHRIAWDIIYGDWETKLSITLTALLKA